MTEAADAPLHDLLNDEVVFVLRGSGDITSLPSSTEEMSSGYIRINSSVDNVNGFCVYWSEQDRPTWTRRNLQMSSSLEYQLPLVVFAGLELL
jgi:hypothetical protein